MGIIDRLNNPAKRWNPAPGDTLVGKVISKETRDGQWGPYPVLFVVDGSDTEWEVRCSRAVLRRSIDEQGVAAGDEIGIKYFGKDEHGGYERYRVVVEHNHRHNVEVIDDAPPYTDEDEAY